MLARCWYDRVRALVVPVIPPLGIDDCCRPIWHTQRMGTCQSAPTASGPPGVSAVSGYRLWRNCPDIFLIAVARTFNSPTLLSSTRSCPFSDVCPSLLTIQTTTEARVSKQLHQTRQAGLGRTGQARRNRTHARERVIDRLTDCFRPMVFKNRSRKKQQLPQPTQAASSWIKYH